MVWLSLRVAKLNIITILNFLKNKITLKKCIHCMHFKLVNATLIIKILIYARLAIKIEKSLF